MTLWQRILEFFKPTSKRNSQRSTNPFNNSPTKYVDLKQYGYVEAGACAGNHLNYSQNLDEIAARKLLDVSLEQKKSEQEIRGIEAEIDAVKIEINDHKARITMLKAHNKRDEDKINGFKDKMIDYISGKVPLPFTGGRFDWVRFAFLTILLLLSTLGLYLFYCGVIFKGIVLDVATLAKGIKLGTHSSNILPNVYELYIFFSNNTPYAILPIVFFVFGYILDTLFNEVKSLKRTVSIILILLVTVGLDFIIAFMVQRNLSEALVKNQQVNIEMLYYKDGKFYLALVFGFISFIFWSVMMFYWNKERHKKNIFLRIEEAIHLIEKEIHKREDEIIALEGTVMNLTQKITTLENMRDSPNINVDDISSSINTFTMGWFNYLAGLANNNELIQRCEDIKNLKIATIQ